MSTKNWLYGHLNIVLFGIGVLFLILPVDVYKWLALPTIFGLGTYLAVFLFLKKTYQLSVGVLGVFVIGMTYLLDLVGIINSVSESPMNSYIGYTMLSFGFLPVLKLQKEDTIQLHDEALNVLSQKEVVVAKYIAEGKKDADIALSMGITINTVKTYNKRIFSKLKVKGRKGITKFIEQ